MNNLPGIDLKIEDADGKINGVMIFYFQERSDASAPSHVASESPVPLLVPHAERKTLTFEVQHHKCHACPELRPNVKFRLELAGPDEALLWKLENEEQEKEPSFKAMVDEMAFRSQNIPLPKGGRSAVAVLGNGPVRAWSHSLFGKYSALKCLLPIGSCSS